MVVNMQLGHGLEVIDQQHNSKLKAGLLSCLESIYPKVQEEGKLTQDILDTSGIADVIFKTTGIKVKAVCDNTVLGRVNAYMTLSSMNGYHVFYDEFRRRVIGFDDARDAFNKAKSALEGTVDLKNSKVSGIFSTIGHTLGIGSALITSTKLDPGELAAIIAHEIGHAFTIIEMIHYQTTTNMVLNAGIEAVVSERNKEVKYVLATEVNNVLGVGASDFKELIDDDNYDAYAIAVIGSQQSRHPFAAFGESSRAYDESMAEQMADMFAARHGLGKEIVTGLNKLTTGRPLPPIVKLGLNVITGILSLPAIIITLPIIALTCCFGQFFGGTYDRPKDRFIRVRNQVINSLKDQSLSRQVKRDILDNLETIDSIINNTANSYQIVEKIGFIIRGSQRDRFRNKKLQQQLESLLDNTLYSAAAKLETM